MRIVHVVPHVDEEASGPSYAVPRLCEALASLGHDVELTCLAAGNPIPGVRVDVHPQWSILERFAISTSHPLALRRKAVETDVIHNHSLWSMVNVAAGWVVPGRGARLVTSPHGTLSSWALSHRKTLKRLLWLLQRRVLTRAGFLHATCEAEYQEIRALGIEVPVAVIPIGIDLPQLPEHQGESRDHTLLFLGRIHPKKGIDRLLYSWREIQNSHPSWRLVIAGRGEPAHEQEAKGLTRALSLERVEFLGPVYGSEKSGLYAKASLFVLPTHSENFGIAVAEALAHACPAIVGRGAPWSGLERNGCGWWVSNDVPNLVAALSHAMALTSAQRHDMGLKGRRWMERDFGWEIIAKQMEAAYQWNMDPGDAPEFVRLR